MNFTLELKQIKNVASFQIEDQSVTYESCHQLYKFDFENFEWKEYEIDYEMDRQIRINTMELEQKIIDTYQPNFVEMNLQSTHDRYGIYEIRLFNPDSKFIRMFDIICNVETKDIVELLIPNNERLYSYIFTNDAIILTSFDPSNHRYDNLNHYICYLKDDIKVMKDISNYHPLQLIPKDYDITCYSNQANLLTLSNIRTNECMYLDYDNIHDPHFIRMQSGTCEDFYRTSDNLLSVMEPKSFKDKFNEDVYYIYTIDPLTNEENRIRIPRFTEEGDEIPILSYITKDIIFTFVNISDEYDDAPISYCNRNADTSNIDNWYRIDVPEYEPSIVNGVLFIYSKWTKSIHYCRLE